MSAHLLTREQVIDYAEKLYEVEILSEKGRDLLMANIQHYTQLSELLQFCAGAFTHEAVYRSFFYVRSSAEIEVRRKYDVDLYALGCAGEPPDPALEEVLREA